jgi:SAM-dependent methyltransferase
VIEGVAELLPFKDCTYDYVLYVTTVCFVDSPIKAFIEAYRVLKPAGHIVIGMIDRNSKLGRQYEARKQGESRFFKDATFYAVSEVQAYLQQTGFIDIECAQAILPADVNGHTVPEVKRGYGEGSFVVLRAHKSS